MEYRIYRQALAIEAEAEVEKMVGEKVPEGYRLEVTIMSVTDITSGAKVLELGYVDISGEDRVICMNKGTNVHHHDLTGRVFLMAGEQPYGRITTASAGDDCYFICHGKLWPVE